MNDLPLGNLSALGPGFRASDARKPAGPSPTDGKLREVSREFESVFLEIILKEMRTSTQALNPDGDRSFAKETYDGWQDQLLAQSMASGNGIGLGEILYRQMQRQPAKQADTGKMKGKAEY